MSRMQFNASEKPTIGVEVELALIDPQSMALTNVNAALLDALPPGLEQCVKPELMQCYVEINTGICDTVDAAETDLRQKLLAVQRIAEANDIRLHWTGTHPFSKWGDQVVTDNARYHGLIDLMQDTARQLITFGLHVHVGVDSGDKAVMICDRILRHLPTLLALSCNSPFWEGRDTGLHSWRSRVMDGLPTAGLPPLMRNWSEYVWLIHHLVETGYIETVREIWWDVRPHHNFGTVEVRICDVPGSLEDTLGIVALVQSLITALSNEIDDGVYLHDCHPMMVRQNKWQAARYGLDANLVDSDTYKVRPARKAVRDLVEHLLPTAQDLGCDSYMQHVLDMSHQPTGSQRQVDLLAETGSPAAMVRTLSDGTRLNT